MTLSQRRFIYFLADQIGADIDKESLRDFTTSDANLLIRFMIGERDAS
jgi:hypothetical protein